MNGYDPLMLFVGGVFTLAAVAFYLLSRSRKRNPWFAKLSAFSCAFFGVPLLAAAFFELVSWRAQVLLALLAEAPLTYIICAICLAQAGRVRVAQANQVGAIPRRGRLVAVLRSAPYVLFGTLALVGVLGMLRPAPYLFAVGSAPPELLLLRWTLNIPQAFYSALAAGMFFSAARTAPVRVLRIKNYLLSFGIGCWPFLALNTAANAAVRVYLPPGPRGAVGDAQVYFEMALLLLSLTAIAAGLAVRHASTALPATTGALVQLLSLLRLRDRFEARGWQLTQGGRVRGIKKSEYRTSQAAARLGLSYEDHERSLATIRLCAVISDPSLDELDVATLENARRITQGQRHILETSPGAIADGSSEPAAKPIRPNLDPDPMPDALPAALHLLDPNHNPPVGDEAAKSTWFNLAAVASFDAQLIPKDHLEKATDEQVRKKVTETYGRSAR